MRGPDHARLSTALTVLHCLYCSPCRRALGMDLTKPAVLLVGGGEGMGPVEKTVDGVAKVNMYSGGLLHLYS